MSDITNEFYSDLEDGELFSVCDVEDLSGDLKWRAMTVESNHIENDTCISQASWNGKDNQSINTVAIFSEAKSSSTSHASFCPSVPFGMAGTNFTVEHSDFNTVFELINNVLLAQNEMDFSYFSDEFLWRGKKLSCSGSMEVDINLYHDKSANNYVVAARKLRSDCGLGGTFQTFFAALKSSALSLDSVEGVGARKRFVIPNMASMPGANCVTDAEFLNGSHTIFRMCLSGLSERIQGAKMLCDVSKKEAHYLELPEFHSEVVRVLEALVQDDSDEVRQYAVMAVAAFAELASYKEAFLHSSILPALFGLVENCTNLELAYQMAQVRRTAASVLAVMCRTQPFTVRMELQKQRCDVHGWLQRVSCLRDSRTRESAMICKQFLQDVSVSAETTVEDCMTSEDFATLIH